MKITKGIPAKLFLLAVMLTATIGAGVIDAVTEIVPFRPYSAVFKWAGSISPVNASTDIIATIAFVTILLILVASLIRSVANVTTGITLPHSGFTPNGNLTGSPAVPAILQLYPLIFAFLGLAASWVYFKREEQGI